MKLIRVIVNSRLYAISSEKICEAYASQIQKFSLVLITLLLISDKITSSTMRLRDREEIFASILVCTGSGDGISLTKIMFNSYLTYFQILEYSKTLIERGFLEYDKTDKTFNTTPSGFKFLELYNEMSQIIKGQQ